MLAALVKRPVPVALLAEHATATEQQTQATAARNATHLQAQLHGRIYNQALTRIMHAPLLAAQLQGFATELEAAKAICRGGKIQTAHATDLIATEAQQNTIGDGLAIHAITAQMFLGMIIIATALAHALASPQRALQAAKEHQQE